jgi:hypothetical protein
LASTHWGIIGYTASDDILRKEGLYLRQKKYYNLTQKETKALLSNQEELQLVITILKQNGFHPCTREEDIVENSVRIKRVVRDIFFILDKQIHIARRFISGFLYKTNATFNTNTRRLLLTVIVGIDNTGYMFPMAFMFITSELAKFF